MSGLILQLAEHLLTSKVYSAFIFQWQPIISPAPLVY